MTVRSGFGIREVKATEITLGKDEERPDPNPPGRSTESESEWLKRDVGPRGTDSQGQNLGRDWKEGGMDDAS